MKKVFTIVAVLVFILAFCVCYGLFLRTVEVIDGEKIICSNCQTIIMDTTKSLKVPYSKRNLYGVTERYSLCETCANSIIQLQAGEKIVCERCGAIIEEKIDTIEVKLKDKENYSLVTVPKGLCPNCLTKHMQEAKSHFYAGLKALNDKKAFMAEDEFKKAGEYCSTTLLIDRCKIDQLNSYKEGENISMAIEWVSAHHNLLKEITENYADWTVLGVNIRNNSTNGITVSPSHFTLITTVNRAYQIASVPMTTKVYDEKTGQVSTAVQEVAAPLFENRPFGIAELLPATETYGIISFKTYGERPAKLVCADKNRTFSVSIDLPDISIETISNFDAFVEAIKKAEQLTEEKNYEAAKEAWVKVLSLDPKNKVAEYRLREIELLLIPVTILEIKSCPSCKDGLSNCCHGTGKCQTCEGTGKCVACEGHGYFVQKCTDCNGTGKCQRCKGSGYIKCSACDGSGHYVAGLSKGAMCIVCGGTGYVNGKKCHHCQGKGYLRERQIIKECRSCKGSGKVECPSCKGKGKCGKCGGTGTYKESCASCHGRGICAKCRGSGNCVSCYGTGICLKCLGTGVVYDRLKKPFYKVKLTNAIEVDVPGCKAFFDGSPVGDSPLTIKDIGPGKHHMKLTISDKSYDKEINMQENTLIRLLLTKLPVEKKFKPQATDGYFYQLGVNSKRDKRYEESNRCLEEMIERFPKSLFIAKARALIEENNRGISQNLYNRAVAAYEVGQYQRSDELAEELLAKFPESNFVNKVEQLKVMSKEKIEEKEKIEKEKIKEKKKIEEEERKRIKEAEKQREDIRKNAYAYGYSSGRTRGTLDAQWEKSWYDKDAVKSYAADFGIKIGTPEYATFSRGFRDGYWDAQLGP